MYIFKPSRSYRELYPINIWQITQQIYIYKFVKWLKTFGGKCSVHSTLAKLSSLLPILKQLIHFQQYNLEHSHYTSSTHLVGYYKIQVHKKKKSFHSPRKTTVNTLLVVFPLTCSRQTCIVFQKCNLIKISFLFLFYFMYVCI